MKIIEEDELAEVLGQKTWGYRFSPLTCFTSWQQAALRDLEMRADREDYNVPWEMKNIQVLSVRQAYIPMYIIETQRQGTFTSNAAQAQHKPYYLVYTGIAELRDSYFERIVNTNQTVYVALKSEQERDQSTLWYKWLQEKRMSGVWPHERADGSWHVSLPEQAFGEGQGKFPVSRIGDYELRQGYFIQIWCDEERLRRRAALDRALRMVKKQQRYIKRATIEEHLQLLSRLLQVKSQLTMADLRQRAIAVGMKDLVKVLEGDGKN